MRLWFARDTEITLRDQLVTQVKLAILCHDLAPGQRLPSTRELARRFSLHPNTVSAGYRELEREHWVEFRHGSGIYVSESKPEQSLAPELELDRLIAGLFPMARALGVPLSTLREHLRRWSELRQPESFLLIEPDEELRRIVSTEMQTVLTLPVRGCAMDEREVMEALDGAIAVALPSKAEMVRRLLPPGSELLTLQVQSATASLVPWLPAPERLLVGVVSRWPEFLRLARTMLLAAGFPAECLVLRDPSVANWRRGLQQTAAVVCESASVAELPKECRPIVFRLLTEATLEELRRCEDFLRAPGPKRV